MSRVCEFAKACVWVEDPPAAVGLMEVDLPGKATEEAAGERRAREEDWNSTDGFFGTATAELVPNGAAGGEGSRSV
jgi:hypothetical protein